MTKAIDIADYIVYRANKMGLPISNLQLQKIMYFLNAMSLLDKDMDTPLFEDETFERWDYGPVLPKVYSIYSVNGASKMTEPASRIVGEQTESGWMKVVTKPFNKGIFKNITESQKNFINKNLGIFIRFTPFSLVYFSHKESQWVDNPNNTKYKNQKTKEFYSNKKNRFWEENNDI